MAADWFSYIHSHKMTVWVLADPSNHGTDLIDKVRSLRSSFHFVSFMMEDHLLSIRFKWSILRTLEDIRLARCGCFNSGQSEPCTKRSGEKASQSTATEQIPRQQQLQSRSRLLFLFLADFNGRWQQPPTWFWTKLPRS